MIKFEDLISGNYSDYPEEIQEYMKKYTELLREKIIAALIKNKADMMLKGIENGNEYFISVLSEILENGTKGYKKMPTQTLIEMYLNVKGHEEFAVLLESINDEI